MAEALACRWALNMAMSLGLSNFCVSSDCLELVDASSKGFSEVHWSCSTILEDILDLSASAVGVSFSYECRKTNLATDWLAKTGDERMCPLGWVCAPPSSLCRILEMNRAFLEEDAGIG